jgi:uncharacterized tellurite resistance protein B-like protein
MTDDSRPSRPGDPDFAYISESLTNMFQANDRIISHQVENVSPQHKSVSKVKKKDLELALTILLVEIASSDQNFEAPEYQMIILGLYRMFGTGKTEVQELINQAMGILSNLRGTSKFAALLKDNLTEPERKACMEVIDDLIMADGVVDGYEAYLRIKLAKQLEVPLPPLKNQGDGSAKKDEQGGAATEEAPAKKKLPAI